MNKLKKVFSGMIQSIQETLEQFPITIILMFALTIFITIFVIGTSQIPEFVEHTLLIGVSLEMGVWLTEVIFKKRKSPVKYIGLAISLVIAIFIDRVVTNKIFDLEIFMRWVCEYYVVCILLSIYILAKRSEANFEKYSLNLMLNLKRTSIIYGIVLLGVSFLFAIFKILILDSLKISFLGRIVILFTGFYYIPVCIKSFTTSEAEDTKFNKVVFLRVLFPLLILAMLIIYMYIFKVMFITEIPKNELFLICSVIFMFSIIIYTVNRNYCQEENVTTKLIKAIPYLYIPFIFIQMYSMGIRIADYGLTTSRYMACVLMIFEVISIGLIIFKKSKYLKEVILSIILLSLVVTISPINCIDMPKTSQRKIVERYIAKGIEFNNLDEEEKKRFAGSYQYIQYDENYSNVALSDIEKDRLKTYNTYRYHYNTEDEEVVDEKTVRSLYLSKELTELDISKYSKLTSISTSYNEDLKDGEIGLRDDNYNEIIRVNLAEYIKEMVEANEITEATSQRIFEEGKNIVEIDNSTAIYITNLTVSYYKMSQKYYNVNIRGYLLQK